MRLLHRDRWYGGHPPRLRRALVVGCAMVLIGSVTAVAPTDPAESDETTYLHPTPWEAADTEAQFLADRILRREGGGLMLDDERQYALRHEVKQALSLIRRAYPAMADVRVREEFRPGRIILGLEGELRDAVVGTWNDETALDLPPTGHAAFDALNAKLGLRAAETLRHGGFAFLNVDERVDVLEATLAYLFIDSVDYARPDWAVGDSSDIDAAKVQGTWHVVFRDAWGDCPAGCIHSEPSFFTVADGEVQRIEPVEARAMEPFASLLADRSWR